MGDRIEDIMDFDRQAKGIGLIVDKLGQLKEVIISTNQALGNIKGADGFKAQSDAMNTAVASGQKLAQTTKELVIVNTQVNGSLEANIKLYNDAKAGLEANARAQKELRKDVEANRISADQYRAEMTKLTEVGLKYKAVVSEQDATLKKMIITNKQAAAEAAKDAKLVANASNDYKILSAAYNDAALKYKNYALQLGVGHPLTLQAKTDALALGNTLKTLDADVGQMQRNVGNYMGAVSKLWGAIRTAAYIIPGLGIGGAVLFIAEPFIKLYEYLTKTSEELENVAKKRKIIADIVTDGSQAAGKEITDLKLLYGATQDVSSSIEKRTKAAKILQDTYPDTFKNFTTEQILLGKSQQGYDDLTASIIKSAMAAAAKKQLEDIGGQKLEAQKNYMLKLRDINSSLSGIENDIDNTPTEELKKKYNLSTQQQVGRYLQNAKIQMQTLKMQKSDLLTEQMKLFKDLGIQEKILIDFVGADNLIDALFNGSKKGGKEKEGKTPSTQQLSDIVNSEFKVWQIAQKRKADFLKESSNSENVYYTERINYLKKYVSEQELLITVETKAERAALIEKNINRIDQIKKDIEDQKITEQSGLEEINIIHINQGEELKIIEAKKLDAIIRLHKAAADELKKIVAPTEDVSYDKWSNDNEDKMMARFRAAIKKGNDDDKKDQDKKATWDEYAERTIDVFATLDGVVQASEDKEIASIDRRIDAYNRLRDVQVANIKDSTLSEQEKAIMIRQVEQETALHNEELERKKIEAKRKSAQFEKAVAIASISINTAKAIMKDAAESDPFTKAFFIATDIALGAAQTAAVMATPLPQYKHGLDNASKDHFAITGDGGQHELIIDPHGNVSVTPNKDTLTYLERGSKVIGGNELNQTLLAAMFKNTAATLPQGGNDTKELIRAIRDTSGQQVNALKRIRPIVTIKDSGNFWQHITKSI